MAEVEYPPLFTSKGEWNGDTWPAEVLESLSPERRQLFDAVKDAAIAEYGASAAVKQARADDRDAVTAQSTAEVAAKQHAMTHYDLWRETFGRPRKLPAGS